MTVEETIKAFEARVRRRAFLLIPESGTEALARLADMALAAIEADRLVREATETVDLIAIDGGSRAHLDHIREMPPIPNIRELEPDQNPFYSRAPRVRDWERRERKRRRK
jgi:hypothetical protein